MLNHRPLPALRKVITVEATPERAFELFTTGIQQWWPLATHSVGEQQAVGVAFGEGLGGTIVETLADGSTEVWARVTRWEPPHVVAFTWYPGNPESEAGNVEVTFTPNSSGGTVVELVHSGWDRRPDGGRARAGYDTGWDVVLDQFVRKVVSSKAGPQTVF
jgi:uncharacterized protein YndB with AHSA1/START domain